MNKWNSSQIHRGGSTFANQSMSHTTLTEVKNHMIISIDDPGVRGQKTKQEA